ncbi:nucleotidyltransferase [Solihabitans fulvus]|uniref:Nucleotidyltransferase n=1 Tax=Solihabitans fulvus TaxID=1892852 RepID=A0A5B2X4R6_9PSEU|nr:nucleotidyltransferase domain-containing protein [Solihabitans fulvus]KAA2258072.1 nucleotidyltransferase [Solihabitans fulvus]
MATLTTLGTVLLSGVVGSTAYGLAGPDSDVDRLGMFAAPTSAVLGLHPPADSHVTTDPDVTLHEVAKAVRLLLRGNPTVAELLWLPENLYETRTALGDEAIGIRDAFLCAGRVRDAYLGYAGQQFRKLISRPDGTFSADTRRRTAKHARHLMRLVDQGYELYATGRMQVRLSDPERYLEFGRRVAADPESARPFLAAAEARFDAARSVLSEEPDTAKAEDWLLRVRREFWTAPA